MSELDVVERAVLITMAELGLGSCARHMKNATILDEVSARHGISPSYAWQALVYVSRPWMVNVPLVDFLGNNGTPSNPPAEPRYTESRLTPFGELLATAALEGSHSLPVRLINGTLYVGGDHPPFSALSVIETLRAAAIGIVDRTRLITHLGLPTLPSGCAVDADWPRFWAGESVQAILESSIVRTRDRIIIEGFPPSVGAESVVEQIKGLLRRGDGPWTARGVMNTSIGPQERVEVLIVGDAGTKELVASLRTMWPLRIEATIQIPMPIEGIIEETINGLGLDRERVLDELMLAVESTR